jgi:ATP-dependent exoDNAse (exonuclease V) alpha subunit
VTHNYTQKEGVVHTEILLPEYAPAEYTGRAVLWNAVEKIENAKNVQLAREIELALPSELTREQNISLACEYVRAHFVSEGMCADLCIYDTGKGNPHAHVLLTMRPLTRIKLGEINSVRNIFSTRTAGRFTTRKRSNTSANPFPQPTETSRPKPRFGGRRGHSPSTLFWSGKM